MSIKIKSVCLNQPSDSFLYISSFCPPLYSRSTPPPKIFSLGRFCGCLHRKSVIFTISVYTILSYIYKIKSSALSKANFFCCSVSVIVTSSKLKDRFHHAFTQLLRSFSYLVLIMQCVVFSD